MGRTSRLDPEGRALFGPRFVAVLDRGLPRSSHSDPTTAIVAALATYGAGHVARPIGAFVLGHWGDTHGRKTVLLLCMFAMGFSTMAVGLLPTYAQVGVLAPVLLVMLRLVQGFAVAGEVSGASSMILGYVIRREVEETPAFAEESADHAVPRAPIPEAFRLSWDDMLRVVCMAISQNTGTTLTAALPAIFALVAPPGSANIPLVIGAFAFVVTAMAATAALSTRETSRLRLHDLGRRDAVPVDAAEYERLRASAMAPAASTDGLARA